MLRAFIFVLYLLSSYSHLHASSEQKGISKPYIGFVATSGLTIQDNSFSGQFSDAFNCLFDGVSLVNVAVYPSPYRLLQDLSQNKIDVGLLLKETEKRNKNNVYIADFFHSKFILMKNKALTTNSSIGVRAGSDIIEQSLKQFLKRHSGYDVVRVRSTQQLNSLLLTNRIQFALDAKVLFSDSVLTNENFTIVQSTTIKAGTYVSKAYNKRLGNKGRELLKQKHSYCKLLLPSEFN